MSPRRITDVDHLLSFEDGIKHATGETVNARRRTVRKFGKLKVIVIEETGEPTCQDGLLPQALLQLPLACSLPARTAAGLDLGDGGIHFYAL